ERGGGPAQHPGPARGRAGSERNRRGRRDRRDEQRVADKRPQPRPAVGARARQGWGTPRPGRPRLAQCPPATTLISLNIGRYMATTMPPTMPPMTTIITGSMIDVMASTADSASAS